MGNSLGTPLARSIGIHAGNDINAQNIQVGDGNSIHLPPRPPSPVRSFNREDSAIVVARPSEFFKGRIKVMADIEGILTEYQSKISYKERILVVYGIPGIGKSELMRQFAQKYESKYPNIAWINAESADTITEGFKHLAGVLQVDLSQSSTLEAIATKVYKHIENFCEPNSSLIVLDNVTNLAEIRSSLPVSQSIKIPPLIVMTTNERSDAYRNLELKELYLTEALEVFQGFMNLSQRELLEVNNLLEELAVLVGCHPLAVVISASHISRNKNTISKFLREELRDYIASVRELSDRFANSEPKLEIATAYRNTLKALWELTVKRIKENEGSDAALYMLRLLGYLDPENVEEIELRRLCVGNYPLVDEDDGWTAYFNNHGTRAVCAAIGQLERLSVLMPISRPDMDTENPRYRIHRLLQHFARRQDVMQIGIRRVFYHCIDLIPPFVYPGCFEYLETMMENKIRIDEKLKQTCIAVAITAKDVFPGDMVARLINHFETDEGTSDETEVLLLMAQLYNPSESGSDDDDSSAIENMSLVLSVAENWIKPGYAPYLIQNCALKIILNTLFTSPECFDKAGWPEGFSRSFKVWLGNQAHLYDQQTVEDQRFFSKMLLDKCQLRTAGAIKEVLELDENINSAMDFVSCLVCQTYDKCRGNGDLHDGYWHLLAGCFRINACKRFLQENMKLIVKHATDTLATCNDKNTESHDGLADCFLLLAMEPKNISSFCSEPDFLQELNKQTKFRVYTGFSFFRKDIYWGIFLLVASVQDPNAIESLVTTSWNLVELLQLPKFLTDLTTEAALFYRRWAPNLDEILGILGGRNFLQRIWHTKCGTGNLCSIFLRLTYVIVRKKLNNFCSGPKNFYRLVFKFWRFKVHNCYVQLHGRQVWEFGRC